MKDNWKLAIDSQTLSNLRAIATMSRSTLSLVCCVALSSCIMFSDAEEIERTVSGKPAVTFEAFRSKDPQSSLGAKEHPKILEANGGAYSNPELEKALALIAGELVTHSNDPGRAYDITVLNSPSVNAFALPGGYLYLTRGLLALANDSSEVAAVLAHEMAHVSSNHGIERSKQVNAVGIADRVVTDVLTNKVTGKVVKASTERRLATFSQQQELQADAIGIKLIGKAGFDPFAAPRFLQSMQRYGAWRSASASSASDMNSSHPSNPQRIELARRHARLIGPVGTGNKRRDRYLQAIDGMQYGDSAKEGFIRGNTFSHRGLGITFSVPTSFELTNRAEAVLASGPDQQAMRFDAVTVRGEHSPAKYLKSGWVNGLIESTVRTRSFNGLTVATGKARTDDWQFSIAVFSIANRYYRFILAAPKNQLAIDDIMEQAARTFRQLSKREISKLKPLRLKLIKVRRKDTIATLASRMKGVSRKVQLFRTLNALDSGDRPSVGSYVKVVTD